MVSHKKFDHLKMRLDDIKLATKNFNVCIGGGGFGKVYKGELVVRFGGHVDVAVKRLDTENGQGAIEFWKEIMMLSLYKHKNTISLLGFCDEGGEYLLNASLDKHLSSRHLSWIDRLNVCIQAARGLEHLHNPSHNSTDFVLHRDIKSSNILMDSKWNVKISDFGLSKFGHANQDFSFMITHPLGTMGYYDPIYHETGILTKESDVYSFGVVLFEVLCGRFVVESKYNDGRRFLLNLVRNCYKEKKFITIVLDCLQEQISPCCLEKFSNIAYRCIARNHEERPSVPEIIKELKAILRCQIACDVWKKKKLNSHAFPSNRRPIDERIRGKTMAFYEKDGYFTLRTRQVEYSLVDRLF